MGKDQSVISFDPISEKKQMGLFGRLLITRYKGGKPVVKTEPYGHYMFCGPQGSGKTSSALWYAEFLLKRYKTRRIKYRDDDTGKFYKYDEPPKRRVFSNFGVGKSFKKEDIFDIIDSFDPYANEVRIVLIDEFQTYFPRGSTSKEDQATLKKLTAIFSQLRKRNTFVISTAQIYGRLDKTLREQCLYMVDCKVDFRGMLVNDFIPEKDILCDDLGRWAGNPKYIYNHGLSKLEYDTKKIIRE